MQLVSWLRDNSRAGSSTGRQLLRCYQNEQKVHYYNYETSELWEMIGETKECTRVYKLKIGFRKNQTESVVQEVHPEISHEGSNCRC